MPRLLDGLKRHMLIGLYAALVTAAISLVMSDYYRSEARLLPVDTKSSGSSMASLASAAAAFGVSVPGADSNDSNLVDILKSRWISERLLLTQYQFHEKTWRFGKDISYSETLYQYFHRKNMDRAVQKLSSVINANKDIKTKVLLITATTKSPELSQEIVQNSIRLLELFVGEKGRTRGGAKAIFASDRLEEARQEMSVAEGALQHFVEANRNYQTSTEPSVRLRGNQLEAELKLRMQLVATLAMSREQALMDEKNDVPILNVMDNGNLPYDKCWPPRSILVLIAFFLGTAGAWGYTNRAWVKAQLLSEGNASPNPVSGSGVSL
jgi:uncharacterized protein involved in exopolysaccharide biosynthesis